MELGEKIRQARLEAGYSQRQLCGEEITRNMLSQIENGTARPSMKTLRYLAQRLGKNVSYFLEETAVVSPNLQVMEQAREAFDRGAFAGAWEQLKAYRMPDSVCDREYGLLYKATALALAQDAIGQGKTRLARELLEKADRETAYCQEALERRRLLLQGRLGEPVSEKLPELDEELLLRAKEALEGNNTDRAACLAEAAENRDAPWQLLRGRIWLKQRNFAKAAQCLTRAEEAFPEETAPLLEECYRELGDFRRAYQYAIRRRNPDR